MEIRTVSNRSPVSVIRTSTDRRRCKSIPTICRPVNRSLDRDLLRVVGCEHPEHEPGVTRSGGPAPSSHQPHGAPLTGHTGPVTAVAFSPDGQRLATSSADRTVRLWDTATGQPHGAPLTGHTDTITSVAFSIHGELLATASSDGTARLWDTTTGQPHGAPLTGHTGPVTAVAFSPDGQRLAISSADRTVRLWDTATGATPRFHPHQPPPPPSPAWPSASTANYSPRPAAMAPRDSGTPPQVNPTAHPDRPHRPGAVRGVQCQRSPDRHDQ